MKLADFYMRSPAVRDRHSGKNTFHSDATVLYVKDVAFVVYVGIGQAWGYTWRNPNFAFDAVGIPEHVAKQAFGFLTTQLTRALNARYQDSIRGQ